MQTQSIEKDEISKKLEIAQRYSLNKEDMVWMLKNIYTSRKVDDAEIAMKKQTKAFFQISGAGHEGILTAAAKALRPSYDWFVPYYRDRALCLGLGVTAKEMLCQANGNVGDTASHGRQMPAHWGSKKLNILNKSSCTGTQFLQACGLAEAAHFYKNLEKQGIDVSSFDYHDDEIVYASCGDGTTSQGELWEALTTASTNNFPVLFMIEDNGYAISTPVKYQTPAGSISKTLESFPNLKVLEVNGNCPIESYDVMMKAAAHIRNNKGPALVHAHVTRPYSHSMSDDQSMYRTKKELEEEKELDVFKSYPKFLVDSGILSESENKKIFDEVSDDVKTAMKDALLEEWPDVSTHKDHLFSTDVDMSSEKFISKELNEGKSDIPMASAINSVLKSEFKKNPFLRMFGEDVADFSQPEKLKDKTLKGKGGVFKVSSGVQKEALEGQVFNSPLAEANIIGRAIGMAARGIKPVVEIQFFDYIWTAYMQLKNEMATLRYRSGGDFTCPMVIRVPIGGYLRGGAIYHSQSGESFFAHIPGIKIAFPSNAKDAAGLLRTSIKGDDPVLFLEHKHLYYQGYNRMCEQSDDFTIPFGKARVAMEGADATVICWGALVQKSIDAAKKIAKEGKTVEVIDARTIVPFDMEAVKKSLSKTNRLLIAHEETKTSGFAGEICARVNEECFEYLDAPIKRVAAVDTHVAYNPALEDVILPQTDDVYNTLKELLAY